MDSSFGPRPPRPSVGGVDISGEADRSIDYNINAEQAEPDIQLPKSTTDSKDSGGRFSKIGGKFKGVFNRGKKASPPSKNELDSGRTDKTPSRGSEATTGEIGSSTELLRNKRNEEGEGRFGKVKGKVTSLFSRGKKAPPPPHKNEETNVTMDTELGGMPPLPGSYDGSRTMSTTAPSLPKSSDKSTTFQSMKAFVKGPSAKKTSGKKKKPLCRSSNVLNVLLILLIIAGIVMTAMSGQSKTLKIIGPLCIGISAFALIGKIFLTLYFQDDPFPRLRPLVERVQDKINQKRGSAPPAAPPSVNEISHVNMSVTGLEMVKMEEVGKGKGMNIADEALRTSTPTLQMDRSRTPEDFYKKDPTYRSGTPNAAFRAGTPDEPYVMSGIPVRSGTPNAAFIGGSPDNTGYPYGAPQRSGSPDIPYRSGTPDNPYQYKVQPNYDDYKGKMI